MMNAFTFIFQPVACKARTNIFLLGYSLACPNKLHYSCSSSIVICMFPSSYKNIFMKFRQKLTTISTKVVGQLFNTSEHECTYDQDFTR